MDRRLSGSPARHYAVLCELSTGLASVVGDNATEGGPIHQFAAEMKQRGIKPELEVYHPGCAWVVDYLIENNLISSAQP